VAAVTTGIILSSDFQDQNDVQITSYRGVVLVSHPVFPFQSLSKTDNDINPAEGVVAAAMGRRCLASVTNQKPVSEADRLIVLVKPSWTIKRTLITASRDSIKK